jgi:16S rRNA U1498 N3-methylase RsmE
MPAGRPKGVKNGQSKRAVITPVKPPKKLNTTAVNIRVTKEDYALLSERAEEEYRSVASLCSALIHFALKDMK